MPHHHGLANDMKMMGKMTLRLRIRPLTEQVADEEPMGIPGISIDPSWSCNSCIGWFDLAT